MFPYWIPIFMVTDDDEEEGDGIQWYIFFVAWVMGLVFISSVATLTGLLVCL